MLNVNKLNTYTHQKMEPRWVRELSPQVDSFPAENKMEKTISSQTKRTIGHPNKQLFPKKVAT